MDLNNLRCCVHWKKARARLGGVMVEMYILLDLVAQTKRRHEADSALLQPGVADLHTRNATQSCTE